MHAGIEVQPHNYIAYYLSYVSLIVCDLLLKANYNVNVSIYFEALCFLLVHLSIDVMTVPAKGSKVLGMCV